MNKLFRLSSLRLATLAMLGSGCAVGQQDAGPSYDCSRVEAGSTEALICDDPELSALDLRLADVYRAALAKATDTRPLLRAEQRGWIAGRDDCWKSDDRPGCVGREYQRRIAELQATYRLVAFTGPVFFGCDGNAANEVTVTFFATNPPTLVAERGDSVSLMYLEPAASGARYVGRNESFWSKGRDATVVWGFGAEPMQCTEK